MNKPRQRYDGQTDGVSPHWSADVLRWKFQLLWETCRILDRSETSAKVQMIFRAVLEVKLHMVRFRRFTVRDLALQCGCTEKTVTRGLEELQAIGLMLTDRDSAGRITRIWIPFRFIHNLAHSIPSLRPTRTKKSGSITDVVVRRASSPTSNIARPEGTGAFAPEPEQRQTAASRPTWRGDRSVLKFLHELADRHEAATGRAPPGDLPT